MRRHAVRGFTLIELMIVVIIIAALASMVAPRLIERSDEAKAKIAKGDISSISLALKLYRLDNDTYPDSLEALTTQPGSTPNWKGPYLEKPPVDPWGRAYKYKYPAAENTAGFAVYSVGKDGQESGDDITN